MIHNTIRHRYYDGRKLMNINMISALVLVLVVALCFSCDNSNGRFLATAFSTITVIQPPLQRHKPASLLISPLRNIAQRTTKLSALPETLSAIIGSTGSRSDMATAATTAAANTVSMNDQLWIYFWQVVIQNGIPALFAVIVLAFGAFQFRPQRGNGRTGGGSMGRRGGGGGRGGSVFDLDNDIDSNPIAILYDDLYGSQDQDPLKRNQNPFSSFNKQQQKGMNPTLLKNIGIPKQQFIKVTYMNDKYDSFTYSVNAATTSKANAALQYRQSSLVRALRKVISTDSDTTTTINTSIWTQLQKLEQIYLLEISELYNQLNVYQNQLTLLSIQDELVSNAGMDKKDVYKLLTQIDPKIPITAEIISTTSPTSTNTTITATVSDITTSLKSTNATSSATGGSSSSSSPRSNVVSTIQRIQKEINELDMEFVKRIIRIAGPDKAAGINAALLGTPGGTTSTGLLSSTTINGERPLTRIFGSNIGSTGNDQKKNIYVMNFPGDVTASQVSDLRQVVTSIILAQNQKRKHSSSTSTVQDEAIVVLQSGGGTVTGYGLAAAQLLRLKEQGQLKLTICVEQVAASGGYMMACCADTIVASPFAVLGSIGVISDIPNVYDRLKKEGIEFQTITAGKYKRTVTPTKKVTTEDLTKSKKDIEEIYTLFRNFVKTNRPQLDIDSVATGETWFGTDALDRKLCDEIKTVDDVLVDHVANGHNVYQIEYKPPIIDNTVLGRFLSPATDYENISSDNDNILQKPIKWLVRTISDAVKDEVYSTISKGIETPIEKRYMMTDDTANRIRSEDR